MSISINIEYLKSHKTKYNLRSIIISCFVLLLFISCCLFIDPDVEVNFINNSTDTCTSVNVKKAGAEDWGENVLGSPISTGTYHSMTLGKDLYDFQIEFLTSETTQYLHIDLTSFDFYDFKIVDMGDI